MPKVSVLIPTYNCALYIGQAIQSVLDQTFKDFEIIISDNASTDNTEEIVKKFKDSRIRYYKNQENIDYTRNVYRLIHELATGEYCIILCADDYWVGKELLTEQVDILDNNANIGFVWSDVKVLDETQKTIYVKINPSYIHRQNKQLTTINGNDFLFRFYKGAGPRLSSCLFRRELAIRTNAYKEDSALIFCPDLVLWWELSLLSDGCIINMPLVVYRWGGHNLTHSIPLATRFNEEIKSLSLIENFVKIRGLSLNLKKWRKRHTRLQLIENLRRVFWVRLNTKIDYSLFLKQLIKFTWDVDKITFLHPSYLFRLIGLLLPLSFCRKFVQITKRLRGYKTDNGEGFNAKGVYCNTNKK